METSLTNRNYFTLDNKNYLAKFFRPEQYLRMSDFAKNHWLFILKNSFFARIPASTAHAAFGVAMNGPCTLAIYHEMTETVVIVADSTGFFKTSLSGIGPRHLENMAVKLDLYMSPPAVYADSAEQARQEIIQGELDVLERKQTPVYLAGV